MRVANLAERNGIDQIDMPRHQGGKRLLGFASCILLHELHVIDRHSPINPRRREKVTVFPEDNECCYPVDDKRPAILLDQKRAKWRWTWGYVEDVAAAIACASTDERANGRIYNVGERVSLTQAERVKAIAAAVGWNGRVLVLPESQMPDHLKAGVDFAQDLTFD